MTNSALICLSRALLSKKGEVWARIGHFGALKAFHQTSADSEPFSSREIRPSAFIGVQVGEF